MTAAQDALEPVEEGLARVRSLSALLRFALAAGKDSAGFDPEVRSGCWIVAGDVEVAIGEALDAVEAVRR